jgi:hypothetical protein
MPTPRVTEIWVQFNTKLGPAVIERTKGFAEEHHKANIQEIVEHGIPAGHQRASPATAAAIRHQ